MIELLCGDCLELMREIPDSSVQLVAVDPPYFKVKDEPWDRQWDTADGFIAWIGQLCEQWQRVLAPNGSLYVFASPKMAARVEVEIGRWFNVLSHIVWIKTDEIANKSQHKGWHNSKEAQRAWWPESERIIFAEHYGADNAAKGEAGYGAKCDELRGFVFEPLRAYLAGEWERAGLTRADADKATNSFMSGHYLSRVQWTLPTREKYEQLRVYANANDHGGEYLRREYEDLRREYEDLRRPFTVSADVPYTDVWTFLPVSHYAGKHPCETPLAMMEHIIKASSREGDTVLDCCMGSGVTGKAAVKLGRHFIGMDLSAHWVEFAKRRIQEAMLQPSLLEMAEAAE
jgi:adenine-specific DNA-methyltransferase